MTENKKRNKSENQVINSKGSKSLKDSIKEVFVHALVEKEMSEERFDEVINDKNFFLEIFSPWHKGNKGGDLIEDFIKHIDNQNINKDFSWLNILNVDKRWKKFLEENPEWNKLEDKNKYLNMRYQIPTHFHGDIDEAVIFHCMENPRGYLGDWDDNEIDTEFQGVNLDEFYKKSADKLKEKSVTLRGIIEERYKLEDIDNIQNIIYSEESNLLQELNHMFKQDDYFFDKDYIFKNSKKSDKELFPYYYIREYYRQILNMSSNDISKYRNNENNRRTNALDIAKKICNVEIYPFSSSEPNLDNKGIGNAIFLNSELSRFGIYILLRRIYKYLQEEEKDKEDAKKPVVIFRKYDKVWGELLGGILNKEDLEKLEDDFFYCQLQPRGGGITSGNVISMKNYKIYQEIFQNLKESAFEEISDVLN